ncbi:hypothetical protein [Methanobacterium oryzae]
MPECPRCEDTEKIHYISKFTTDFCLEFQCICGSCGNVFREVLDHDGW